MPLNKPLMTAALLLSLNPLMPFSFSHAKTVPLDKIVAIVDEDVVMESELERQLAQVRAQMRSRNAPLPDEADLKKQVLEHLIVQRIQLSMAERGGMQLAPEEIDQAIARLQRNNGLTLEQLQEQLANDGLSLNQLRQQIAQEILIQRVQQYSVNRRIQVSEQEVDAFLASEEGKFWLSPQYLLGHILIPFEDSGVGSDLKQTQAKANRVLEQLKKGQDFRQMAVAYSAGQNALKGGDLGWRKSVELPELFSEQIKAIDTDESNRLRISNPFKSGAGFHFLKIYDKRGSEKTVIKQSKVRHILLKPSEILSDVEALEKIQALRSEAMEKDNFAELAKLHSEDIGSKLSGGDLGWSLPGKFVPEFEETMNNIQVGRVSQPFRSQFGWHILLVDERRDENMTDTVIKNQAVNLLRQRRFNEELQIWLQEIRGQAFVDLRLKSEEEDA